VSNSSSFLAVVNPAAGGGRCRKLVSPVLDRLRAGGISLKVVETTAPGQATRLVHNSYRLELKGESLRKNKASLNLDV
jgi:diacylglycerol kinase family enzyme